ncbi:MAG: hypothetical protein WCA12_18605 [Burkholderiales bacterium]
MYPDTLKLVASAPHRRPTHRLHRRLDPLLRCLADLSNASVAERIEDEVWAFWMRYPDARAVAELERATRATVVQDYGTAECILHRLVAHHPGFAEAWHKRAMLYYLQGRDDECVRDLHRTIVLEPRHYGAICSFAEICLEQGEREAALFAFDVALKLNPHLSRAREQVHALLAERHPQVH